MNIPYFFYVLLSVPVDNVVTRVRLGGLKWTDCFPRLSHSLSNFFSAESLILGVFYAVILYHRRSRIITAI